MINWASLSVNSDTKLKQVLAILDEQIQAKIVLVVQTGTNFLLGTITDGDVRRALIAGKTMESVAEDVMQRSFVSVTKSQYSELDLLKMMKEASIEQIPIVDDSGVLCGLRLLENDEPEIVISTPVVIMAGGLGTRLKPLTDNCPKPMLKVDGKPMLEIILEGLTRQGFVNFYITINYLGEQIIEYFGDGGHLGINIQYIHESKRLGTAGALSLLPEDIDETVIVLNGDVLTNVDYKGLLAFHEKEGVLMSICVREHQTEVPYGVVDLEGVFVKSVTEKPRYNDFVNAGIYVIQSSVFKFLEHSEYKDMPDLVKDLLVEKNRIAAFPMHEYWMDIGRHSEFRAASEKYLMHIKS